MSRSRPTCPIMIDNHLMLIFSLTFRWILGDALVRLGIEPNHWWWYLLSCNFFENLVNQVINLEHIPMKLLTFYAWWKAHIKSSRSYMERRSGAHCFCWRVGRACVRVSAPCVDRVTPMIGPSATERWYVQKRLSFCVVSGVALWKPIGRCLRLVRTLQRVIILHPVWLY
jgi:hypothetical protein